MNIIKYAKTPIIISILYLYTSCWAQDFVLHDDEYIPYSNERYDTFDWKLLKAYDAPEENNILISPFSVKMVLAMLYEGSAGSVEQELKNSLSFPVSKQLTRERFHEIILALNSTSKNEIFNIGSGIFLDKTLEPIKRYSDILQYYYSSFVSSVNFSRPAEATQQINKWASNATHGHIKELVQETNIRDAIMILTNALYYKGLWRLPFNKDLTTPGTFYTSENRTISVDYMLSFDNYFYADLRDLEIQFLRLPFKGNISMFIVLPYRVDGLKKFMKDLTPEVLQRLRWLLNRHEVDVRLPKFSISHTSNLKKSLINLGVSQIFENIDSLPGISTKENVTLKQLVVTDVIQKAGIIINEEGGTAYVATEATLVNKFGGQAVFNASKPFMFYLEDEYSGTILFSGIVKNPNQSTFSL